jgi:hypothetical protein
MPDLAARENKRAALNCRGKRGRTQVSQTAQLPKSLVKRHWHAGSAASSLGARMICGSRARIGRGIGTTACGCRGC